MTAEGGQTRPPPRDWRAGGLDGLRALDAPGCLPAVQAAGFPVARQRIWSGRGKLLGDVARGRRPQDPLLSVTIMRADLVTRLRAAALDAGARIVAGQRLDGQADERAADADLVVGADGIWSGTRHALDPAAVGVPALAALFGGEAQAAALLQAATSVRTANLGHVLKPITRRHDGRIVLIDDAAHPGGAGQGASIALEDAVVLARLLRERDRLAVRLRPGPAAGDALSGAGTSSPRSVRDD